MNLKPMGPQDLGTVVLCHYGRHYYEARILAFTEDHQIARVRMPLCPFLWSGIWVDACRLARIATPIQYPETKPQYYGTNTPARL